MKKISPTLRSSPRDYIIAFMVVIMVVGACFPVSPIVGYQAVGLIFLVVISLLSLILGRGAVFFAAILSSAVWNFFFIPPVFTLHIHRAHDVISLVANLMVALVGATLITRIRKSRMDLLKSQEKLQAVNSLLESLNNASSIKDVVRRSQDSFKQNCGAGIVIFLKEKGSNTLGKRAFGDPALFGEETVSMAMRFFSTKEYIPAGFHPLEDARGIFGVIGIRIDQHENETEETQSLVRSFISQVTSALEREISVDLAKEREISQESDKLFDTILNSVSHELRTPISVISAAVSNLQDPLTSELPEARKQITGELESAAKRLNFLVENILDMSRIESGRLKLNICQCDPEDLVGMALRILEPELREHPPEVVVKGEIQPISGDVNLLVQALVNVIHNATIYTPSGTRVKIDISGNGQDRIDITVSDSGPGVPVATLEKLFDKFYRVPGSRSGGTGLGLTITKAITEVHQGTIKAEHHSGGGLSVTLGFPTDHHRSITDNDNQTDNRSE
ncbi:MAG: ATP-binding protein [bacterium]